MKKNAAGQSIGAQMITAADGTPFTGAVSVLYTLDNGTQTAGGNTAPVHEGNGYHSYTPLQAETNGDHIAYTWIGTGAINATVQVFTTFPQSTDHTTPLATIDFIVSSILIDTDDLQKNQGDWLTAAGFNTVVPPSLSEFNARSLPSADYFVVTDYIAPDNAGIAANGLAIDGLPTLVEFNARTLISTDYFNPAVDTVATVTTVTNMRGTDGANTVVPPSVVQFDARTLPSASYSQFDYTTNEVSANTVKVNGASVLGNGTSSNLWRGS